MRPPWTGKETSPERGQLISLNPQTHWIQAGNKDNLRILSVQVKEWKLKRAPGPHPYPLSREP